MVKSSLKLLVFYVISVLLLSPIYAIVVFVTGMTVDNSVFLLLLIVELLLITTIPLLISFKLFRETSKKLNFIVYLVVVFSMFLCIYAVAFTNIDFMNGFLLVVAGFIFNNFGIVLLAFPILYILIIVHLYAKKNKK